MVSKAALRSRRLQNFVQEGQVEDRSEVGEVFKIATSYLGDGSNDNSFSSDGAIPANELLIMVGTEPREKVVALIVEVS